MLQCFTHGMHVHFGLSASGNAMEQIRLESLRKTLRNGFQYRRLVACQLMRLGFRLNRFSKRVSVNALFKQFQKSGVGHFSCQPARTGNFSFQCAKRYGLMGAEVVQDSLSRLGKAGRRHLQLFTGAHEECLFGLGPSRSDLSFHRNQSGFFHLTEGLRTYFAIQGFDQGLFRCRP